jgi:hypothetical protein
MAVAMMDKCAGRQQAATRKLWELMLQLPLDRPASSQLGYRPSEVHELAGILAVRADDSAALVMALLHMHSAATQKWERRPDGDQVGMATWPNGQPSRGKTPIKLRHL